MTKKDDSIDPVKLAAEIDEKAMKDKVAEYMGPTPEEANSSKPAAKPGKESDELLPTDKTPQMMQMGGEDKTEPTAQTDELDNPETSKAVDEIIAAEGDAVLEAEDDKKLSEAFDNKKSSFKDKLKKFFGKWWGNPKYRKLSLAGFGILLAILLGLPPTRYFMLNTVGVRASASLTVLDESTTQPLKNVTVAIGNNTAKTDQEGKVKLSRLKLGPTQLKVEKRAFAVESRQVTIGLGSNPLGEESLTPTGSQYVFKVTDFLSGKPVAKAEAVSGEASALSDEEGKIVLTVEDSEQEELKVIITGELYRNEELTLGIEDRSEQKLELVPGRKQIFVSKRSGKYDLYKIDVDGKNEEVLMAGSGKERDNMTVVAHPSEEIVAFVSTREGVRNSDGYLLSQLYIIDVKTAKPTLVTSSEQIQVVGWVESRLVYVKEAEGTSGSNPKRNRLLSYDYESGDSDELASTNYFNDVLIAGSTVYYAQSSAYQPAGSYGLFRINADGSGRQAILNKEAWNVFRTEYDKLSISVPDGDWYEYRLGSSTASKASGPPAALRSKLYLDNEEDSFSLWVEERDGKGALLAYDVNVKTDKVVHSQNGLGTPLRWLSNKHVVFRIKSGQETADYVINIEGGEPRKIKDVTNTNGIDSWYYY